MSWRHYYQRPGPQAGSLGFLHFYLFNLSCWFTMGWSGYRSEPVAVVWLYEKECVCVCARGRCLVSWVGRCSVNWLYSESSWKGEGWYGQLKGASSFKSEKEYSPARVSHMGISEVPFSGSSRHKLKKKKKSGHGGVSHQAPWREEVGISSKRPVFPLQSQQQSVAWATLTLYRKEESWSRKAVLMGSAKGHWVRS